MLHARKIFAIHKTENFKGCLWPTIYPSTEGPVVRPCFPGRVPDPTSRFRRTAPGCRAALLSTAKASSHARLGGTHVLCQRSHAHPSGKMGGTAVTHKCTYASAVVLAKACPLTDAALMSSPAKTPPTMAATGPSSHPTEDTSSARSASVHKEASAPSSGIRVSRNACTRGRIYPRAR